MVELAAGSIRNSTEHTDADLRAAVTTQNLPFVVEKNSALPQVLIMHTHATESYQTWPDPVFDPGYTARSKSTALNMCAVGEKMAQVLNAAGIRTLHDENGNEYSYLFWEGENNTDYDFSKGFCVAGADTADFLREKLARSA